MVNSYFVSRLTEHMSRSTLRRIIGLSPASVLVLFALSAESAYGSTYYVATISSPWRTIQHAASSVKTGDTVYVRAGTYNEVVSIPTSGSGSAGAIPFSSCPGELAKIDGTGLSIPNAQWGLITIENQSNLVHDDNNIAIGAIGFEGVAPRKISE